LDVVSCPGCGQQGMQQIAIIHDESVLRAMLVALERKGEPP
jgi:hypothetical protein